MEKDLKQAIGTKIHAARKRAAMSQEVLADHVGRTPESISNIERGKQLPNVDTLAQLARILNVPLTEFFEGLGGRRNLSRERVQLEAELFETARDLTPKLLRIAVEQVRILKRLG